jgi:hypothetical protein
MRVSLGNARWDREGAERVGMLLEVIWDHGRILFFLDNYSSCISSVVHLKLGELGSNL